MVLSERNTYTATAAKLAQNHLIKQPDIGILFLAPRNPIKPRRPYLEHGGRQRGAGFLLESQESRRVGTKP